MHAMICIRGSRNFVLGEEVSRFKLHFFCFIICLFFFIFIFLQKGEAVKKVGKHLVHVNVVSHAQIQKVLSEEV